MNKILALDLGMTFGWAIQDIDKKILSGVCKLKRGRFNSGGYHFVDFENWLKLQIDIDLIAFEIVRRHIGTDAAHMYGGFLAILMRHSEVNNIPVTGFSVGTIKKFITGKGNASKEAMIEAVKNKGFAPKDHNEADAIAIVLLAGGS